MRRITQNLSGTNNLAKNEAEFKEIQKSPI
jgi:hypothetical protein